METSKVVECPHCGYTWLSRVSDPKACPSCKRYLKPGKTKQNKEEGAK